MKEINVRLLQPGDILTRYPAIINSKTALVAFAKDPSRVEVKTRLSTKLAKNERVRIYTSMLKGCLNKLSTIKSGDLYLACLPDKHSSFFEQHKIGSIKLIDQVGDNLGSKMESCFRNLLKNYDKVIIFGTDIPDLPVNEIESFIDKSTQFDVLIGPSFDGGYYAIGLNTKEFKPIFADVKWSSGFVLEKTLANCKNLKLNINYLPKVRDIDTFEDLVSLNAQLMDSDTEVHKELQDALLEINFASLQDRREFNQ